MNGVFESFFSGFGGRSARLDSHDHPISLPAQNLAHPIARHLASLVVIGGDLRYEAFRFHPGIENDHRYFLVGRPLHHAHHGLAIARRKSDCIHMLVDHRFDDL